jgi:hypothetical protein
MPMPATGLLQLYLWQGRMRVENLPAYIRRQMSRHPALTAALTPRLGACPGQTILVLRSRGLWQRRAGPSADAVRLRQTAWVTETGKTPPPRALHPQRRQFTLVPYSAAAFCGTTSHWQIRYPRARCARVQMNMISVIVVSR